MHTINPPDYAHPSRGPLLPCPRGRIIALVLFCAATLCLLPLTRLSPLTRIPGVLLWVASAWAVWGDPDPRVRRRFGVLLGCVAILAASPINTDTSPRHFLTLGIPFLAVILGPAIFLGRTDPDVIRYRFWPRKLRWLDLFYTAISVPLAMWIIGWYFRFNPNMYQQWTLPAEIDHGAVNRLFWGINGVGVWDELFFVNTVFAVLRSMFSFRVANLAQAVVYMSVLNRMAFIGVGPALVYLFALTQGSMFEESENLLYVLIVHLVVDYFLVSAIVAGYYPAYEGFLFH